MITIDWANKVIQIPKAYLTLIQSSPFEILELDVNQFRLDLRALEGSEDGMPFDDTHRHSTEKILSGVTYARFIEIVNGYTIEFEDGQYGVTLNGANNNLLDVKVGNQVSLLGNNSAGLIVVSGGGGGTTAQEVWEYPLTSLSGNSNTTGYWLTRKLLSITKYLGLKKHD